jgi:hypothetical protein
VSATPGEAVPGLPSIAATWENTTVELIVTVWVIVDVPGRLLLTVNLTSHVPALVTGREVNCPDAGVEHPAVPPPEGKLHE